METDGDEGGPKENSDCAESSSLTKPFRVKVYPSSFSGPFVVYFRKKEKPINVLHEKAWSRKWILNNQYFL